ncbi:MAG: peptidylprolyl isomerase [Bacteroidia bacterium]|nr:peptidylprolyl isomerase [Bacteroidia bacterium]
MKTLLLITCALLNLATFGQDYTKKLKKVKTVDEANTFIKENPTLNAELLELNSNADSSELSKKIYGGKLLSTISIEGNTYKILEIKSSVIFRASYIYLDASKLSIQQIDSLRKVIISKYRNGTSFPELAKEYNMDGNPTCDLGWAAEGLMVKEFSAAVKEHKKGDIFTVDVPSKVWYHVVLKTFDDREVKTYSILRIKSSN